MGGAPAVAHLYASLGYERVMPKWAKLGLWALVIGTALFCGRHAWAHQAFASTYSLEMVKIEQGGRVPVPQSAFGRSGGNSRRKATDDHVGRRVGHRRPTEPSGKLRRTRSNRATM